MKCGIGSLVIAALLSGCAVTYTYDGQKYDSKEKFHQAVDSRVSSVTATIVPFPAPLSKKKLVIAIPSQAVYIDLATKNFVKIQGSAPTGAAKEIVENIPISTYKGTKVFADAVIKRNIFASTQFVDLESGSSSLAASQDSDALYLLANDANSVQWYYTSAKHGKQIFAYDRSSPTPEGKVQAFVDAVQAQAIRD